MNKKTLIIGSGAFAKALASVLLFNNQFVNIFGINKNEISELKNYFDDLYNNKLIKSNLNNASTNINELFNDDIDIVILCTPSYKINEVIDIIKPFINNKMIVVSTSKGLNWSNNDIFYTDILIRELNNNVCALVGPTFAIDIIEQEKTIINVISEDHTINQTIINLFNNEYFKVVENSNLKAASLLSSLKNVLAIACGIANSLNCSNNTFSSLLTMGVNEINEVLKSFKINNLMILDFCGIGDIFLTCTDKKSRNFNFGYQIGKFGIDKALKLNSNILVEGLLTLKNINKLIDINDFKKFPIFWTLYKIITNKLHPNEFINYLWKII